MYPTQCGTNGRDAHHARLRRPSDTVFFFPNPKWIKVWFQNRRAKFRKQERLTQQKSSSSDNNGGKEGNHQSPGDAKESRGSSSAGSSAESPRDLDIKPQMGE